MTKLLTLAIVALLIPAAAGATLTARAYYLNRGDSALTNGGDTARIAVRPPALGPRWERLDRVLTDLADAA